MSTPASAGRHGAASFRDGFLSEFIGMAAQVKGSASRAPVGKIVDFLVSHPEDTFPRIDAVKIKTKDGMRIVPIAEVAVDRDGPLLLDAIPTIASPHDDEALSLVEDLLDKQIVDVDGRKVVRINDLELAMTAGILRVVAAEVGVAGLLRRLGVGKVARDLVDRVPRTLIAWNNVAPIHDLNPSEIKLSVSEGKLSRLHPSDLAEIIGELSSQDAARVMGSLDDETAADALEHLDSEKQRAIIDDLGTERAADIIEEMDADDAADLLGDLPHEQQAELLAEMDAETAHDLRELVSYGEDTAGGLMTTDYVWIYPHRTIAATIEKIREIAPETEFVYYLYVTDQADKLLGVLSLRSLLLAAPAATVSDVMETDIVSVSADTSAEDVASIIARYDLLACPVLDEDGKMQGIVTVDDAIDAIIPEKLKRKLPRFTKKHASPHPAATAG
jgi:CBS domain-containing protein